jgi:hypothetical protein
MDSATALLITAAAATAAAAAALMLGLCGAAVLVGTQGNTPTAGASTAGVPANTGQCR